MAPRNPPMEPGGMACPRSCPPRKTRKARRRARRKRRRPRTARPEPRPSLPPVLPSFPPIPPEREPSGSRDDGVGTERREDEGLRVVGGEVAAQQSVDHHQVALRRSQNQRPIAVPG